MVISDIHEMLCGMGHCIRVFYTQSDHDDYFREFILCKLQGGEWDPNNRGVVYTAISTKNFELYGNRSTWKAMISAGTFGRIVWVDPRFRLLNSSMEAIQHCKNALLKICETHDA